MTETHNQGVDTETLEGFAAFASENPDQVQLGLGATATYEGICAHSLAHVSDYELGGERIERPTREYTQPLGAWKEVLDAAGWVAPTDRLEPIEMALSALAACINVGITINAVANGVEINALETRVRTNFDPAVLFSLADLDDAEDVYSGMVADVQIDADGVDADQIDEWARRAPVYTLVSLGQDVNISIDKTTEIPADD